MPLNPYFIFKTGFLHCILATSAVPGDFSDLFLIIFSFITFFFHLSWLDAPCSLWLYMFCSAQ
ncbi:hypothetical protein BDV40DRAFT_240384 [Aspergillus tamarii]|uniref:Uncharacterized protein n=1 Tax=Aspergillus tamarii TaxID=41984 RepID=A0A5N6ULE5_ASPTM|nr:hypothetical protein BDV40DRAFT_240384 [Aspergillus tamarii]